MPMNADELKEAGKELGATLFGIIKERTGDFLDNNRQAKDFVADRTLRLATLTVQYKVSHDVSERQEKKERMELVESTIDLELKGLALEGSEEAKALFREVVKATFAAVHKLIPLVLEII